MWFLIFVVTFCICLPENEAHEISESNFMASDLNVLDYKFLKDFENESVGEEIFGSNFTEAASDELQPAGDNFVLKPCTMSEVNAVKIPENNRSDPTLWFVMCESIFALATPKPITESLTK
ncbi:hypothetical protein TNCT_53201 [Trichonephila clavata]|uniref:Uncharacterized protein n=1 Tax=Trichonephila clavata TaxID=2740835 RepID=A0A8X6KN32_TRICU|nr:hypothetical protein TNCT_53201 [Trichonephila clavata]